MTKTRNYREYLINSLQDIESAGAYLQAILEEIEPEHDLLLIVLKDLVEARGSSDKFGESDRENWQQLQELLKSSGGAEIYRLIALLNVLGLQLSVTVTNNENEKSFNSAPVMIREVYA